MRKLLLGSIVLITFSLAIIIFQISCQKAANAQTGSNYVLPPATTSTLGGVIVDGATLKVDASGKISLVSSPSSTILFSRTNAGSDEIWKANIDGTNQQKLNISMPSDYVISINTQNTSSGNGGNSGVLKVYNQKILFLGYKTGVGNALFSCDFNGANVVKLIDNCGTSYDTY